MTENRENMSIKYAVCVLEAIGNGLTLSNENDREDACVLAIQAIDKVQQFESIGTIEEFRALKEKSVAKKAVLQATTEKTHYKCPCCNNIMQTIYRDGVAWGHIANYCEWCGQALET